MWITVRTDLRGSPRIIITITPDSSVPGSEQALEMKSSHAATDIEQKYTPSPRRRGMHFLHNSRENNMRQHCLIAGLMLLALGAWAQGDDKPAPAKAAPTHPQFERMKSLVGTWVEADKDGKPTDRVVSVVKLTAGGSALQETLFPGQPMEMLSVYHTDGSDLIMTHYCMLGNQPKMKADPNSPKDKIKFQFAGGTNFDPAKDMHMHEGTLTFIDDDHIEFSGAAWVNGKRAEEHCKTMQLVRKK